MYIRKARHKLSFAQHKHIVKGVIYWITNEIEKRKQSNPKESIKIGVKARPYHNT